MPIDNVTRHNCGRCGHRYADYISKCPRCGKGRGLGFGKGPRASPSVRHHRKSIGFAIFLVVSAFIIIPFGPIGPRIYSALGVNIIWLGVGIVVVDLFILSYFGRRFKRKVNDFFE